MSNQANEELLEQIYEEYLEEGFSEEEAEELTWKDFWEIAADV